MDSLDSFAHPQAIAGLFAVVDLSVAWAIAIAAVLSVTRHHETEPQARPISRKQRFA